MKISLIIVIIYLIICISSCNENSLKPTNNSNQIIKISDHTWMVKNLDVDHYRNGDPIPQVSDQNVWASLKTGAWCYYDNNSENNRTYGKLYNAWAVLDERGLAPEGWHIASSIEWSDLIDSLGGLNIAFSIRPQRM